MKIVVLGAAGMLGRALLRELAAGHEVIGRDLGNYDLCDPAAAARDLEELRPDAVINCAAFTRVDDAEDSPELAMEVNGRMPGRLAGICAELPAVFVQLGTDYIFDGTAERPYREDDPPNPLSVYGRSKWEAEKRVRAALPDRHLIVRSSWLFGVGGRSFPLALIERLQKGERAFQVVNDQRGRPTYAPDLAAAIRAGLEKNLRGTYHAGNAGIVSWHEFARMIFSALGVLHHLTLTPVSSDQWRCKARRPRYSALDTGKLEAAGVALPTVEDALGRYFEAMGLIAAGAIRGILPTMSEAEIVKL
jgi:dTDP-4-dehydrorhamnose reductase